MPTKEPPPENCGTIGGGLVATCLAFFVALNLWGLVFDSTGGEPFSNTLFAVMLVSPILLILLIIGPVAWQLPTTRKGRWIVFVGIVLSTDALIATRFF